MEKFCVKDYQDAEATSTTEEYQKKLRETIYQVDDVNGSLVSKAMCSFLCPCDISDIPQSTKEQWENVRNNQAVLDKFNRCNPILPDPTNPFAEIIDDCEREKAIIMYTGT